MYFYLWSFFAAGFAGWLLEVAYAAVTEKKFVNRGFLNGPLCPIYGVGVVLMDGALRRFQNTAVILLGAFILGVALEFVTGFLMEKIFRQKWWDYSDRPHNFKGYISLEFSVFWAIAGAVAVRVLMPLLRQAVRLIPRTAGMVVLTVVAVIFVFDLLITVLSVIGLNRRLKNLERISYIVGTVADKTGGAVSAAALRASAKVQGFDEKKKQKLLMLEEKYKRAIRGNKFNVRILKAFPNLRSIRYNEQLEEIRKNFHIFTRQTSDVLRRRNEFAIDAYESYVLPGTEKPFAHGFSFSKLFWVFMIGNVIGSILETIYCLIMPPHQFELRVSLVFGPFILIYGLGAVVFTVFLYRLYDKPDILIFLLSMVIGGAFEYICSFAQQAMFGTVSWEYSDTTLNLGGRTNLMYSVFWGILGVLWVKDAYPRLSRMIERIPRRAGHIATVLTTIFMVLNMLLSAGAVFRQSERINEIPATNPAQSFFDEYFDDEYLSMIYPHMQYVGAFGDAETE